MQTHQIVLARQGTARSGVEGFGAAGRGGVWLGEAGSMAVEYFKPKRPDGKSLREVMVEGLKDCDYGTVLNYKTLGDILTVSDKQKIQATVRIANHDLLKHYQRGLRNIPGVGYRIIEPREHMLAGERHRSKAD